LNIKTHIITFCLCLFYVFTYAQGSSKLKTEVDKLKKDDALTHAQWSVCVMNVKNDSLLYSYNPNISLVPASTLKIVTTAAALNLLGADFKFETSIEYDGVYDSISGVITGNVYNKGEGDPTLESE